MKHGEGQGCVKSGYIQEGVAVEKEISENQEGFYVKPDQIQALACCKSCGI